MLSRCAAKELHVELRQSVFPFKEHIGSSEKAL